MSPFIVTAKRSRAAEFNVVAASEGREAWSRITVVVSRCAVATLDEARTVATLAAQKASGSTFVTAPVGLALEKLSKMVGSVGPLPDGTVIEVAGAHWAQIKSGAGLKPNRSYALAEVLAAYNAKQATP